MYPFDFIPMWRRYPFLTPSTRRAGTAKRFTATGLRLVNLPRKGVWRFAQDEQCVPAHAIPYPFNSAKLVGGSKL